MVVLGVYHHSRCRSDNGEPSPVVDGSDGHDSVISARTSLAGFISYLFETNTFVTLVELIGYFYT